MELQGLNGLSLPLTDKLRWKQKQVLCAGDSDIVWVHPTLIAEIEFRAWTADGKLRHAAYKGLRERQDNADVFQLGSRITIDALKVYQNLVGIRWMDTRRVFRWMRHENLSTFR